MRPQPKRRRLFRGSSRGGQRKLNSIRTRLPISRANAPSLSLARPKRLALRARSRVELCQPDSQSKRTIYHQVGLKSLRKVQAAVRRVRATKEGRSQSWSYVTSVWDFSPKAMRTITARMIDSPRHGGRTISQVASEVPGRLVPRGSST